MRLGVIGAGAIVQKGILPHLTQPDLKDRVWVTAICDPAPGRAEAAARVFDVPAWTTTVEELVEREDVDAVTVASPIGLHFDHARTALLAGKHVHVNKTLATTVAECDELMTIAEALGRKIVASPGEVLRPQLHQMRKLIQDGAIGTLCWGVAGGSFARYHEEETAFRGGDGPLATVSPKWYHQKPGGGPMYDVVVYALHVLTTVLGPARAVCGRSEIRVPEREFRGETYACDADDTTVLIADFDGASIVIHGTPDGWIAPGSYPRLFGSKGSIEGLLLNGAPFDYPGKEIADLAPGWDGEQWLLPHVVGRHRNLEEQHVFEDIMQLVDWVDRGIPSPVNAERARHVIDIIESGYRAAAEGRVIALRTTCEPTLPPGG